MTAAQPQGTATKPRRPGFADMLRALFATLRRQSPAQAQQPGALQPQQQQPALKQLPAPQPTSDPPPRQDNLFDPPPPGSAPADRAAFTADFIAQFHATLKKAGINSREPLHSAFMMFGELLIHFTNLANDLGADFEQHRQRLDARLLVRQQALDAAIANGRRQIEHSTEQASKHIQEVIATAQKYQADLTIGFRQDTENLLRSLAYRETRARMWRSRIVAGATLLAVGGIGFWTGQAVDHADMEAQFAVIEAKLPAAALREGDKIARQWVDLMEWNRLSLVERKCWSQPVAEGFRQACAYSFWTEAPPKEPIPQSPTP
jgi:nucleotide-binding universal stress UspA family protein